MVLHPSNMHQFGRSRANNDQHRKSGRFRAVPINGRAGLGNLGRVSIKHREAATSLRRVWPRPWLASTICERVSHPRLTVLRPCFGWCRPSVGRFSVRSIGRSGGPAVGRAGGRSAIGQSIGRSGGRSVNWAVAPLGRSVGGSTGRPSVDRSVGPMGGSGRAGGLQTTPVQVQRFRATSRFAKQTPWRLNPICLDAQSQWNRCSLRFLLG